MINAAAMHVRHCRGDLVEDQHELTISGASSSSSVFPRRTPSKLDAGDLEPLSFDPDIENLDDRRWLSLRDVVLDACLGDVDVVVRILSFTTLRAYRFPPAVLSLISRIVLLPVQAAYDPVFIVLSWEWSTRSPCVTSIAGSAAVGCWL